MSTKRKTVEPNIAAVIPAPQMNIVKEEVSVQSTIKKAKITKDRTLEVTMEEHYSDGGYITVNKACDYLVHDDLLEAFKKMVPHIITICETSEVKKDKSGAFQYPENYELEDLDHISARGFVIAGSGDTEGVMLTGIKTGQYGTINLISPLQSYETSLYPFMTQLISDLGDCKREVKEYLNGKHAQKQLEMEFDEAKVITEEEEED